MFGGGQTSMFGGTGAAGNTSAMFGAQPSGFGAQPGNMTQAGNPSSTFGQNLIQTMLTNGFFSP